MQEVDEHSLKAIIQANGLRTVINEIANICENAAKNGEIIRLTRHCNPLPQERLSNAAATLRRDLF